MSRWSTVLLLPARRVGRPFACVVLAALVAIVLEASGTIGDGRVGLIDMGFDPQRARLIAALSTEAVIVAIAAFAMGRVLVPSLAGIGLFVVLIAHMFVVATRSALDATGAAGWFDPAGWVITLVALVGAAIVVAWAAGTLAAVARGSFLRALGDARTAFRDRRPRRLLARPTALVITILALLVAGPTFGDMVNYTPDVHMRSGGAQAVGLANASIAPPPSPSLAAPDGGADQAVPPGPSVAAHGSAPVLSAATPWQSWRPKGSGRVTQVAFAAPWTGGRRTTADIWVYTPPGYGTSGHQYPVIYEVPWGQSSWDKIGIFNILDDLTDSGTIPGHIAVFVSETGGPYPDSECMDSPDHREHIETYLTQTIVPYIDATYRTIASPAGRSLLGMSQGGYCVSMLALRHPDLFGTAIAFSGYYQAAIRSGQTANAAFPFDGNQAAITAHSPLALVDQVAPAARDRLLFELSADPTNPFYGAQYQEFAAALRTAGIPEALFPTPLGHGWYAPRAQLPQALTTLAAHEVALGAFGA